MHVPRNVGQDAGGISGLNMEGVVKKQMLKVQLMSGSPCWKAYSPKHNKPWLPELKVVSCERVYNRLFYVHVL
jgi:hypothetical protein